MPQINEYVTFKSDDSSVFSIAGGKVKYAIAKIDHMKVVIIKRSRFFIPIQTLDQLH